MRLNLTFVAFSPNCNILFNFFINVLYAFNWLEMSVAKYKMLHKFIFKINAVNLEICIEESCIKMKHGFHKNIKHHNFSHLKIQLCYRKKK